MTSYCVPFKKLSYSDLPLVGGKNASLAEMLKELSSLGIHIPDGFALTTDAYRAYLKENKLLIKLEAELDKLDTKGLSNLETIGKNCRSLIASGSLPEIIKNEILQAYYKLVDGKSISVAVRSSATAEDLPTASFAGQHDSFLNISGEDNLLQAVQRCYISLFNDRAIKYRLDNHFDHLQVFLSVGVQTMIRSDKGSAGVAFSIDPETGSGNVIYITSAWGLGENVVQGAVTPDEFYLFKPALDKDKKRSIVYRRLGEKETKMIYTESGDKPIRAVDTNASERLSFSLLDEDVVSLGRWCLAIEKLYKMPMDIEWAKDGLSGELYILQARPETVHGQKQTVSIMEYSLKSAPQALCKGIAVGHGIASGRVCIVNSISDAGKVKKGDVIVADITNPDWNAMLHKAVSIVTNKGGRTSHASIVARELGIHAVVGTTDATHKLYDGQLITVSCIGDGDGSIYEGKIEWEEKEIVYHDIPNTRTHAMLILADPSKAFRYATYPSMGVGLLRMEFIVSNTIRIHPMALVKFGELTDGIDKKTIQNLTHSYVDKSRYFVDRLSESLGLVAAAFYPREVIVRMSDFKSNEYAQLLGGKIFEQPEENPMLGFRGASRYYHERYSEAFGLECEAIRVIREEMGMDNVKVMIPFCRTVAEGTKVLEAMRLYGLERGKNGLQIFVMAEIPSNVILAKEFAEIFDGFSIGSNDLTQLTLGIDRDSAIISDLFDENDESVKRMISGLIRAAKEAGKIVGICGQAPSDHPDFARFLVDLGIDSISFTPDALLKGIENISQAEKSGKVLAKSNKQVKKNF
ncbi:phosphoenolpyruvate synthase [Algoriphagus persicinus]|uniref:phosphoenolpyruvate synthase n=1 Tax=Algoriphagus persicinus TaxID=3108754 RepID=UPI002B3B8E79|nr:phosphoenolpyruvate synthase [Algoriphagus sp. E1-3-M2]MEB2785254.1 phosphoenolpyruvate synthase [Algoriphagus sp. E1-3-M2]